MKALAELKEKHINKRITVHAPKKYFESNGMHFDIATFLNDNNADCVYYFTKENMHLTPETCLLDYHPSSFDSWNIAITDWDGQVAN